MMKVRYRICDGDECVADVDASGNPLRAYAWGPGIDNLLSMTVFLPGSTNTYYAVKDHLGSVHALVDGQGVVVESFSYDAWGNVQSAVGSGQSATGNRYLFQGREYSFATGLYNFRARWYEPRLGRWLSNDPIGISGGLNLYEAFANNPVNFTDPYGEDIADYNWGWLYNTSDALAGFGDTISWGLTSLLREQMGYNDSTDPCSSSYKGGEIVGGVYDIAWGFRGAAGLGKNALKNSKSVGKGSKLFGRSRYMPKGAKSTFNSGDGIRTGWGWKKPINNDVFRTSWSQPGNRTYWNHIDWF